MLTENRERWPKEWNMEKRNKNEPKIATFHNGSMDSYWWKKKTQNRFKAKKIKKCSRCIYILHSEHDKEPYQFFKLNQGSRGRINNTNAWITQKSTMTPSKITSKNKEMHSSQWIYLENLIEPNLIVFELSWPF